MTRKLVIKQEITVEKNIKKWKPKMDKFELYVYKSSLTCMYPALMEHGSRMESCEISECLWENPRNQNKSHVISISWQTQNCSWIMLPSGVVGRGEFISDFSLQLASITYLYVSTENMFWHVWLAYHAWLTLVIVHFTTVNPFNPQNKIVECCEKGWLLHKSLVCLIY